MLSAVRQRGAAAFVCSLAFFFAATAAGFAQTTYRSIPMDCGGWFSGLAIHSSGRLYGFGDVFGMWRSDNAGQSWQYLQGDFTTFDHFVNGCDVAKGNADRVAFVTGVSATNSKVFTSTDGGATWVNRLSDIIPRRDRGATPLIYHPANDQELWLASKRTGFTGSLWRSTDGGVNWSKMGGSTFDTVVATTIYVRPEFPDQIWVGAVGGLYVSSNRGVSFTPVWSNSGGVAPLYGAVPTVVSIARRADGVGYMGTNTKGWRITATDYNNPATYNVIATNSWWSGWGPNLATVLADGSFVTITADEKLSRSIDGGQTWAPLNMGLVTPPTPPWRTPAVTGDKLPAGGHDMLVQDPTNASRWFITGGKSVFISTDSGSTWKYPPNLNGLAGVKTYKTRFPRGAPDMAVIPCADQAVFTVTDAGLSGNVATCARASIDEHFTMHDVLTSDDGQTLIAAGNEQSTNRSAILRSVNGGADWSKLDLTNSGLPLSNEGITRAVAAPGSTTDFLVLLGYEASKSNNNPGLYRTTNGGVSFNKVTGIPDGIDTGMRYEHNKSWLETDGINVSTRYLSLRASNLPSARGFWRSTDGGSTWSMPASQPYGAQSYIDCMAVDRSVAGRVWVASGSFGLRRSDNGGDSWTAVGSFTKALRVDAAYGRIAVWGRLAGDTWDKIYYSPDNGVTWSEKTGPGHRYAYLSDLAVDPNRPGQIWVSGNSIDLINPPAPPSASAPAVPTNFAVNLAGLQANLSWTDNATDESGYAIEVRVGTATTFTLLATTAPDATSYSHSSLLDGVTYAYRIRALKAADNVASAYTAIVSVTPPATTLPATPSALATSAISTSQVLLSWADNAYNETGTQVERGTTPDSGFALLTTTAAGATSFTDTGLGEGVRFYYRIRSLNALGNSSYTPSVSGVTLIAPPTNFIVSATSASAISLSWTDNTAVETGYTIERGTGSGEGYVELATTAANATSYTDTTVVAGNTYYYRVRARNAVATSAYADEVNALASNYQPPAFYEPFNYALSPTSILGRTFSGTGNSGPWRLPEGTTTVQDTILAGSLSAGRIPGVGNKILLPNSPSIGFLDVDLSETTLALINPPTSGSRTFWVSLIARSPNTLTTRPTALAFRTQTGTGPISLGLYSDSNARYSLTLGNTVNSSNNAVVANTTYLYIAKITATDTDGDGSNGFERLEGRLWQYPASTLPPLTEPTTGGLYRSPRNVSSARISHIELYSGCTSASDSKFTFDELRIGATYAQVALPPPSTAPSNLGFTNITASGATLTWADNSSDETGFKIQRATSAAGPFADLATVGANVTTYADSGLAAGVEYFYRVLATSSSGDSGYVAGSFTTGNGAASVTSYDFNSSQANLESTFNETAGWGALWSSSAGAGGTGGLATDSNDRAALLPTALTTFTTAGQRITLAVAFKARVTAGATNTAGGEGLRLGFNLVNTPLLASGGYLTVGLNEASSNSLPSALVVDSRNNAAGTTVATTDSDALTLTDNEWYRVEATFTYNGGDSFTVATTLSSLGASGSATPTPLDTQTVTRAGLTSLVNAPVYVGFQGKSSGGFGGVRAFDNFSATVPPNAPVIAANQSASGTVGALFSYLLQASNSPTSYALAGGSLPAGVTLNATTGVLSGTPTASGTFSPSFTATNAGGTSPAVGVTLNIAAPAGIVSFRSAQGLAADGSQDLLTPGRDGVANVLKYAFNMIGSGAGQAASLSAPNGTGLVPGGSAGLPYAGVDGTGKLQITYIRRKAAGNPGISYAVEFCDALSGWSANALATETVTSIDANFERVTVTDSLASPLKRFVRIRVSVP